MKLVQTTSLFLALMTVYRVSAFAPAESRVSTAIPPSQRTISSTTHLFETTEDVAADKNRPSDKKNNNVPMPQSYSEMVRQVSAAMRDASDQSINHQIVRVCLPRDATNTNLGVYSEGLLDVDSQNIVLVPPDESWQGGIMQLYYSAAPTMSDALRYEIIDYFGEVNFS